MFKRLNNIKSLGLDKLEYNLKNFNPNHDKYSKSNDEFKVSLNSKVRDSSSRIATLRKSIQNTKQ